MSSFLANFVFAPFRAVFIYKNKSIPAHFFNSFAFFKIIFQSSTSIPVSVSLSEVFRAADIGFIHLSSFAAPTVRFHPRSEFHRATRDFFAAGRFHSSVPLSPSREGRFHPRSGFHLVKDFTAAGDFIHISLFAAGTEKPVKTVPPLRASDRRPASVGKKEGG